MQAPSFIRRLRHLRLASLRQALVLLLLAAALLAGERSARAQGNNNAVETLNFDQAMQVDDLGNGSMTIKMKLTAAQWQNWQNKYGQNKSLLKRDMNKFLSMYDTYDWDVSEKQMEREITITVKVRGTVIHKGNGNYEFRVPKDWRGGERNNNVFSFNYVEGLGGGAVGQFNIKLTTPANASNYREQLSETGEKVIQYSVPLAGSHGWMLTGGLVICLLGAGLVGVTLITNPANANAASSARRSSAPQGALKHNGHASVASASASAAPVRTSKPVIDPPSMSTIPLEPSNVGTPIPPRTAKSDATRRN